MKTKLNLKETIFVSSMLFGMFFGAGNLIFPVHMGQLAGSHVPGAVLGFCLTGVGLPLLAVAAMAITKSDGLFSLASRAGKPFAYAFTVALYLVIGPLFAIPRTATVSFQVALFSYLPEGWRHPALVLFSLCFFVIALAFSLKPGKILTWIGKFLNPLFLAVLLVLLIAAFVKPMGSAAAIEAEGGYAAHSFTNGFVEGYNTLDVLAGLAFGIVLVRVVRSLGIEEPRALCAATIKAGAFSMILMAAIYAALGFMGANSRAVLGLSQDGGVALHEIADAYFGPFGAVLLGAIITLACLKTAIGLITSCSETFVELFPGSLSYTKYAVLFALVSFCIANFGLAAILSLSLPVLLFLYPVAMLLILVMLLAPHFRSNKGVLGMALAFTAVVSLLDALKSAPEALQAILPMEAIEGLLALLPLSAYSMPWVVPALVGFALGVVLFGGRQKETA